MFTQSMILYIWPDGGCASSLQCDLLKGRRDRVTLAWVMKTRSGCMKCVSFSNFQRTLQLDSPFPVLVSVFIPVSYLNKFLLFLKQMYVDFSLQPWEEKFNEDIPFSVLRPPILCQCSSCGVVCPYAFPHLLQVKLPLWWLNKTLIYACSRKYE